jgi:hypothetical protein
VKRRAKLRRAGYAPQHETQLLVGHDWFGDAYGEDRRGRRAFEADAARADWEAVREELLAYWISDPGGWRPLDDVSLFRQCRPGGPGSRPWAWWTWDAPAPRRVVACWSSAGGPLVEIDPADVPGLDLADWPRLWREEPRWRHFYLGMRNPHPGVLDFETEREYLARLGLMTASERAALPAEDPERALDDFTIGYRTPDPDDEEDR